MLKYIITVLVCSTFILALDKHNPEVYETIEEPLPDIIRKARQYGDKYKPQIFIYDKTMQPDLQKWRYHQQQQADSKNMGRIQMHVDSPSVYDSGEQQHKDKDQTVSETQQSSVSLTLEPRWKIIHPKFVNETQNDFSPRQLIRMQEQYGRRQLRRMPILKTKIETNRTADSNNNSRKTNDRKSIYMVKEFDLDTDASEVRQVRSLIDKQDQFSLILPTALALNSHTVFIPTTISEPIIKTSTPPDLNDLSHSQKDMDALNSLLGNTPAAQIHGLKQLLHSQSMQVAPLTNGHINNMPLVNEHNFDTQLISQSTVIPADSSNPPPSPEIQNILQTDGQSLEQMQLQLDDLSRKEGERAITEAQQKAIEYVRSQQESIQQAETEGRQMAIAIIRAHNLQLPELLPESLALTQSLQGTSTLQETGKSQQPSKNPVSEQNNHQQLSIPDSDLQAQTYLELVSQHSSVPNVEVAHHLSAQTASNILTYPEVNNNGLSGINNPHALNQNVEHAQQQAEPYENLTAKAYSQPLSIVQNAYGNSKNIQQVSFQHEHNDEYAPKYSFGYQVVNYNSGINYGHEETRDDKVTKGRYHVFLPDGRVQSVNYWADLSGYHARVTYSDVAHH